ncbi:hypothetical protein [Polaribacter porphyrae]|uniref:Uncharacterized protein n=1 Tax=Polaribacter porphyrae TaxID=1137780 RepID=A0A2S7WRS3_9FLAO|nr:hypothetical protein [Polaribacter porphyrae]PQJ80012.1 hypothetical protein BTO18_12895 [Polaribacter porphyrae]
MKATKFLFFIIMLLLACSEEESKIFTNENGSFVRFFLLVNINNDILEFPEIDGAIVPRERYTKNNIKTLKIPVVLTSLKENIVEVDFSTTISNITGVEITPQNKLTFSKNKKVDTIFVKFTERWDMSKNPEMIFELTKTSDTDVNIGMPNTILPNNKLTINFEELNLNYKIAPPNNFEIIGNLNEKVTINIDFPQGFIQSEIINVDLLSETSSDFRYILNKLPITSSNQISYEFIVDENIKIDELEFQTKLELNSLNNYTVNGLKTTNIKKGIVVDRDNTVFTASNFYNLSDPFYRTYAEHWFDANADDSCDWGSFFAFTFPVIVNENHPNAVLFDDKGTSDPTDDIYHHAFRIGFDSPNAGRTTNPFNLKRWFTNESTDSANSPGFNIPEALEFFPLNGTSKTEGFVKVIENDLQIQGRNGNSYIISISGNGTYKEISAGLIEINLEFKSFNTALFGGTRTDRYKIYNQRIHPDPDPITQNCKKPIEL